MECRRASPCLLLALVLCQCGRHVLVDDPGLEHSSPLFVCLDALPVTLAIQGSGMHPVVHNLIGEPDLVLPAVRLLRTADGFGRPEPSFQVVEVPDEPTGDGDPPVRWMHDGYMEVDITDGLALPEGVYTIVVVNPDGSTAALPAAFLAFRTPRIDSVDVEVTVAGGTRSLDIDVHGGPFFMTDFSSPLFHFTGADWSHAAAGASSCRPVDLQARSIETCATVSFSLPGTVLDDPATGTRDWLVVPFPEGGCEAAASGSLGLPPCPDIISVDPRVACATEEPRTITLAGSSLVHAGTVPRLAVGSDTLDFASIEECRDVPGGRECDSFTFVMPVTDVPPMTLPEDATDLPLRILDIEVPAHCLDPAAVLTLVPPPRVTQLVTTIDFDAHPPSVLINGVYMMHGSDVPTIAFAGEPPRLVDDIYHCDYLPGLPGVASLCYTIMATIPSHLLVTGATIPFTVTNPDPVGCTSTDASVVEVVEGPP